MYLPLGLCLCTTWSGFRPSRVCLSGRGRCNWCASTLNRRREGSRGTCGGRNTGSSKPSPYGGSRHGGDVGG